MPKLLLICCLFFAVVFGADAAVVKKATVASKPAVKKLSSIGKHPKVKKVTYKSVIDSSKVNVRSFNSGVLDKYRNNPDFEYKELPKAKRSWWVRFWMWVWEFINSLFGNSQPSSAPSFPFLKYIIYAVALGLIIWVIVKMVGINLTNIFSKKSKDINILYSESIEDIHQITFDEEIEKALAQRNYRLATKLLYLSTLKQLSDAQLIHWQQDKTNSAYLNELTDAGQRQSFGILTRQFEYIWYGDFPVDGTSFQNINTLFHDFKIMVK